MNVTSEDRAERENVSCYNYKWFIGCIVTVLHLKPHDELDRCAHTSVPKKEINSDFTNKLTHVQGAAGFTGLFTGLI